MHAHYGIAAEGPTSWRRLTGMAPSAPASDGAWLPDMLRQRLFDHLSMHALRQEHLCTAWRERTREVLGSNYRGLCCGVCRGADLPLCCRLTGRLVELGSLVEERLARRTNGPVVFVYGIAYRLGLKWQINGRAR